jgi:hypothetical protein
MPVSLVIPLPSTAAMMVGAFRTMLGTLPFLQFGRSTDLDESRRMEHD